ncbi:cobalamin biosynthesis protein [Rhizobium herbae]|uniref:Cobalamin biosynthesis protein n=1 Tax=Rhizobium herbae TaxID=508661 RepID=A0ABS7H573_9HYPH|nr:cobalamin biosynthesis protein [Rhizobium herbae]
MHVNTGKPSEGALFALGLGCERGTPSDEVIRLAEEAMAAARIDRHALACVASLDARAQEPAMIAAAAHFSVPFRVFDAGTLEAETARLKSPSDIVFALTGCHGVAEAAALAAAGKASSLIVPKIKSANATAAVAGGGFVEKSQGVGADCQQNDSSSSKSDSALMSRTAPGMKP